MNPIFDINIVLVRSLFSRNVGSVSRVMANMNAQRLILVDPKCEYDLEARQGAAGAQTHLLESMRYGSMQEFLNEEPAGIRLAFCARKRKESDFLSLPERLEMILKNVRPPERKPIYFIFGPEDHGLSQDEVEFANHIVSLPTFGEFASLNLSHAVLLALYVFRGTESRLAQAPSAAAEIPTPENEKFYFPEDTIKQWLDELGFEIGDRRSDAYMVFKRILLERESSAKELRVLEAIIQQTLRKLKD